MDHAQLTDEPRTSADKHAKTLIHACLSADVRSLSVIRQWNVSVSYAKRASFVRESSVDVRGSGNIFADDH